METKFTFIINHVNEGYVLISKAYNDEGEISGINEQDASIDEILAKQQAFYNLHKSVA